MSNLPQTETSYNPQWTRVSIHTMWSQELCPCSWESCKGVKPMFRKHLLVTPGSGLWEAMVNCGRWDGMLERIQKLNLSHRWMGESVVKELTHGKLNMRILGFLCTNIRDLHFSLCCAPDPCRSLHGFQCSHCHFSSCGILFMYGLQSVSSRGTRIN